ncbi:MptD family putative ECF transporter S component [Clostridium sporogenes]|uniref:MptD family putative ECF transporter S component n=1 Tax=Clostridium sporogenes TaxID=1509 RepID=UPI002238A469|nr:MptD family putative ECF transporter S component [Clostridium sporogenes]EKS4344592.1 MptD family putative ECF transporter S component [Clostridium botulinum]EKS4395065.1 MptD family putative ECF transporter S component [Clostridium botulinum]MCW6077702.1 MptD family putative ECF transporter S component [Clostridium sporogenes]HDK7168352.1 MptD family putative ECF transporter S component [Clostridium botulinum]
MGLGKSFEDYLEAILVLKKMMPQWMFYVGFVILFVVGICGALLGHKMLKKHFQRAGII